MKLRAIYTFTLLSFSTGFALGQGLTLTSSANPSLPRQTIILTASPVPAAKTVNFLNGGPNGNVIGIVPSGNGGAVNIEAVLNAGTYQLVACYSGSAGAVCSNTVNQVVGSTPTSLTLTSSSNPGALCHSVIFTASVSPSSATGAIAFLDGANTLATVPVSGGSASFSTTSLVLGAHQIQARFTDQNSTYGSSSSSLPQAITGSATVAVTSSPNPSSFGQAVTITSRLTGDTCQGTPPAPTGAVSFFDGTTQVGQSSLVSGIATFTTTTLTAGSHALNAQYGGDSNYAPSSSNSTTQVVNPASKGSTTINLSSSSNPASVGDRFSLNATVTPATATGQVQFNDSGTSLGTSALSNGGASLPISFPTAGSHQLTATYLGDSSFNGSTSNTVTETISPVTVATSTTLSVNPNPANAGQPVTLSATVTPQSSGAAPVTGIVQFFEGGSTVGQGNVGNGTASLQVTTFSAGSHSLTARYLGDSVNGPSASGAVTLTVNGQANTSTSLSASSNPINSGQPLILTANVTPSGATGQVQFSDSGNPFATIVLNNGIAVLTTSTLTAGSHSLTATYLGDANFNSSTSSPLPLVVNKATPTSTLTTVSVSPTTATFGQTVVFNATVNPVNGNGVPTGTITFSDGSTTLSTVSLSGGNAGFSTSSLAVGSHSLVASYSGDSSFNSSSSSPVNVQVNKAATTTVLSAAPSPSSPGQPVLLSARVTPSTATGTVTFMDGNAAIGSPVVVAGGSAALTTSSLSPGNHSLTAVYSGDNSFAASSSAQVPDSVGLTATTTTLAVAPAPSSVGQTVIFSATVAPAAATGSVTFLDGTTTLGTQPLNNGTATFSYSSLSPGAHSLFAVYGGDSQFAQSTSAAVTQTVGKTNSTMVLTASPNPGTSGQPVTLRATITPSTATGTVSFLDGNTPLGGSALVNGTASFAISTLATGNHTLSASYGGDANDTASTATAQEAVNPAACAPSKLTVTVTSLQANFKVTAGQAIGLQASVVDDCGAPAANSSVAAAFSNGDKLINLAGTGGGAYSGTWVPVGPGAVQITVTAVETAANNPAPLSAQVSISGTVVSPVVSTLQAAPTTLSFDVQSGASPAVATVAVTSTGDPLTFTVSTSGGAWVAASPASATTPATVTVTIDPSKLTTPGSYTGSVVLAVGASVVPVPVKVNFTVPAPKLMVPLTPVSFTAVSGGSAPDPQVVTATASGMSVPFTTAAVTTSGGGWLSVDPANGATDANLTITVRQGNLSPGPYSGMVTVKAPDANGGTFQIPVGLTVTAPAATTSLLATPAGLQFQHQVNGTAPAPQTLSIGSSGDAVNFLATAKVGATDPPWLLVSPRTGQTNATLQVTAQPGGLAAGIYNGSIQVDPNGSNATAVSVPVQLTVTPQITSILTTDTTQLTYFVPSNSAPGQRQITVSGTGPQLLNFNVQTATDVGSWLKASRPSAGASADQPATIVITADPAGLAPSTYSGTVTIVPVGPSSQIVIPVAFTVGASPAALVLSQTALNFAVGPPGYNAFPQDVSIVATGQGTVNFTATPQSDGNWLSVTPASGQLVAGSQQDRTISVQVNAAALASGEYHGQIQVLSPDVDNSPQVINVVLQVVAGSGQLGPQTVPTGLAFVGTAGGAAPAPQSVVLFNPNGQLRYNAIVQLDPANPPGTPLWLQFKDASNSGDLFSTLSVNVSLAGLSPNVYRGSILVTFPGNINRVVAVLLVVSPGSSGASAGALAIPRAAAPVCVPSQYLPQFTSLEQNFSVAQGAPASTQIVIVDDCGNVVTSGTAGSTFSTGDRPLDLLSLGDGRWRATWVPRGSQGYTSVNMVATDTAQTIATGQAPPVSGFVQNSINAPVLSIAGAIETLDGQPQLALAPGSWIRIRGTRLADSAAQVSGVPQPQLGTTTVSVGGLPLLLQSIGPSEIVALVPGNIPVNTSLPLVVTNGSYLSAPEEVLVAQSWPVVQSASLEGTGSAQSLVLELTGVGAMDGERPKAPFTVEVGGKKVRVDRLSADASRPGVFLLRLPMGQEHWLGATVEIVGATARSSRTRVTAGR